MSKLKIDIIKKYLSAYLPVLVWAYLIFFLSAQSSLPGFKESTFEFIFKKSAHMFVYAVLYSLLFRARLKTTDNKITKKTYLFPILFSFLYAISDELHQSTVAGRHPTIRDVGFDMLGVSTVLLYQLKFT